MTNDNSFVEVNFSVQLKAIGWYIQSHIHIHDIHTKDM
jgi:hypothetical protein